MSIIHEALKKASRDESPKSAVKAHRNIRFSSDPLFPSIDLLLRVGFIIGVFGIVCLVYVERNPLSRMFTYGRIQTPSRSSVWTKPPGLPSPGGVATSQQTSIQSEPVSSMNPIASYELSAMSYLKQGKFAEAEGEWSKAASLDPKSSLIQTNLGLVLQKQGRDGEAEARYQSALKLDPENVQAMNNLGLLYEQENRLEEAKGLFERAVKLQPKFPDPHLNFAILLERAGYFEEAKRHYRSFLALSTHKHDKAVQLVINHLDRLP